ncbi:MAG: YegS/Rv2252/BmrU family lipid kinase [Clostridia bacterium]|nr:YegS/Rv2252/BmrU family lipid kinase [Clostridia bacterium]
MEKLLLMIVNPASGLGRGRSMEGEIARMYARYGWVTHVRETRGPGDAAAFATESGNGYDMVLCLGGDGTLSETLNGLTHVCDAPPLCYVPMGSTNDLAFSAGLPRDPMSAAAVGLGGMPCPIDAGLFNDLVFSYVACFGAFTRTSYETDRELKNRIGHLAYILTGIQEIGRIQSYPVQVICDGEEIEGDFFFGSVCNTRSLGGALKLPLKKDDLQDGMHELLMVRRPRSLNELSGLLPVLLAGNYEHPLLVYRHIKQAVFQMHSEIPWSLDGEKADAGIQVEIKNLHHAYRLMMPYDQGAESRK